MIVDDNDDDLFVAGECYKRSGLQNELLTFKSGEAFLAYLEQVADGTKPMPALVLLDINMPGLNGFQVLESVRHQPRFACLPVMMMLTNSDFGPDVELSEKLGADGYRTKPLAMRDYIAFFDSLKA